jgi:hypothetical protein
MSSNSTGESGRDFEIGRRQYFVTLGAGLSAALAGCSGDSDSDDSEDESGSGPEETDTPESEDTETETEQQSSVCSGDTFDCTDEFANVVLSELEESGNTPEPIDAGVFESAEGEGVPENAMVFAAFDLTNETTLGRQIGNLVFGPIYENWPNYPETEEFHFAVFPSTDAEDQRTTMHVKKWWVEGLREEDFTVDEVTDNVLDTSTEPLGSVVDG